MNVKLQILCDSKSVEQHGGDRPRRCEQRLGARHTWATQGSNVHLLYWHAGTPILLAIKQNNVLDICYNMDEP